MGSTEELCPGCSGQCPSCGRDIQGAELSEIRQALETSRAETREAREWVDRLTKWGDGAAALIISELDIDGEEEMNTRGLLSQARAFLAGRGGSPTGRGARSLEAAMGETKPCDVPVCEWEAAYRQVIGLVRDWANEQVKEDGPDLTPGERKLILLVLSHDKDPRLPAAVIAVGMLDATPTEKGGQR